MHLERRVEVIIVGAGAAGLGCAIALQQCGIDVLILEKDQIGSSFHRWPKQMRLITPSFYSNPFLQTDLNAITPHTSLADFLQTEHPTGLEYATYLTACAQNYEVPVETGIEVQSLEPLPTGRGWRITTSRGPFHCQYVIWAIGEFSRPDHGEIIGAEHCLHNSRVLDWEKLQGDTFTVIGGYESGMDAAVNLAAAGKKVRVLSRGEPWQIQDPDPSRSLSPYTRDRLRNALQAYPERLQFYKQADIQEVERHADGWLIRDASGNGFRSLTPPILCTGFRSALEPVRHLFAWQDGNPVFSEEADESTLHSGLYYSGPSLTHRQSLFCFIYKFRSRFGIIARAIAERLDRPWEDALHAWKQHGFMIEDLGCCTDCQCAISSEADAPATAETYHAESLAHV